MTLSRRATRAGKRSSEHTSSPGVFPRRPVCSGHQTTPASENDARSSSHVPSPGCFRRPRRVMAPSHPVHPVLEFQRVVSLQSVLRLGPLYPAVCDLLPPSASKAQRPTVWATAAACEAPASHTFPQVARGARLTTEGHRVAGARPRGRRGFCSAVGIPRPTSGAIPGIPVPASGGNVAYVRRVCADKRGSCSATSNPSRKPSDPHA